MKAVVLGDLKVLLGVQVVRGRDLDAGPLLVLLLNSISLRVIDDGWSLEVALEVGSSNIIIGIISRGITNADLAHGDAGAQLALYPSYDALC